MITTAEAAEDIGIGQRAVQKRILRLNLKTTKAGPVTLLTAAQVEKIRDESGKPGPKAALKKKVKR